MKNLTSKQLFYIMMVCTVALIALAGLLTTTGISLLKKQGSTLTNLKREQLVIKKREMALDRAEADIIKYTELEKISKSVVPQEKDQARTVREIVAIADNTGVSLSSITFPESTLGAIKTKGKKSTAGSTDPTKTQLTLVPGTKGLYALDITIQSDTNSPIPYNRLLSFLSKLEQNRRTAHVTNISIQPHKDNRNAVTFSINLNVYIKP